MQYVQTFFIQGRYYGKAYRPPIIRHATLMAPPSALYVCPECGDAFARCPVYYAEGHSATTRWQTHMAHCNKHGGGSLWRSWDKDFLDALPPDVLRYEFNLALMQYDQEMQSC